MVENAITTVGTITTATSTICSGDTPFPITGSAGAVKLGGALEYQWYRSTNGVSWTEINLNGTSQNYTPTSGIVVNTIIREGQLALEAEVQLNVKSLVMFNWFKYRVVLSLILLHILVRLLRQIL